MKDAGKREQTFRGDANILPYSDRDCHRFFYFSEKQRKSSVYIVENTQIRSPDSVSAIERDALSGFPSVPLSQVLPLYRQPP